MNWQLRRCPSGHYATWTNTSKKQRARTTRFIIKKGSQFTSQHSAWCLSAYPSFFDWVNDCHNQQIHSVENFNWQTHLIIFTSKIHFLKNISFSLFCFSSDWFQQTEMSVGSFSREAWQNRQYANFIVYIFVSPPLSLLLHQPKHKKIWVSGIFHFVVVIVATLLILSHIVSVAPGTFGIH